MHLQKIILHKAMSEKKNMLTENLLLPPPPPPIIFLMVRPFAFHCYAALLSCKIAQTAGNNVRVAHK